MYYRCSKRSTRSETRAIEAGASQPPAGFQRYIGIDYSGAQTPYESLKGIRAYLATPDMSPIEIRPPASPRKYWTRHGLAEWLVETLSEERPTLVGIDHSFSFPLQYFQKYGLSSDWTAFLIDFRHHWPTHNKHTYVDFVRDGLHGFGKARNGSSRWRRIAEVRARAKSVFHFDAPGSVAKSTHAGLPWLLYMREQLGGRVHFWPFDGWTPQPGQSVVVEAYPSLVNKTFPKEDRDSHQHDAYSLAAWFRQMDRSEAFGELFHANLNESERRVAEIEGWIFGVE